MCFSFSQGAFDRNVVKLFFKSRFSINASEEDLQGTAVAPSDRPHDNMTWCLMEQSSAVKLMKETGDRRPVHLMKRSSFFQPAPKEHWLKWEMSGVHLVSIRSFMSPSRFELTGLSTQPGLHRDSRGRQQYFKWNQGYPVNVCKCVLILHHQSYNTQSSVCLRCFFTPGPFKPIEEAISCSFLSNLSCWAAQGRS